MRRKRKRLVFLFLVASILILFILIEISRENAFIRHSISGLVCDKKSGESVLRELCKAYDDGMVAGSLCLDLCKTRDVVIKQCLSHKKENIIFGAVWKKENIILKTKKISLYNSWKDVFPENDYIDIAELQQGFVSAVYDHVVSQLVHVNDIISDHHKLSNVSPNDLAVKLNFLATPVAHLTKVQMQSFWQLLQQDEYYLMQLLKDFKHIPKITGTCGRFYAMEKVETLLGFGTKTWATRVKMALDVMDLVEELDSSSVNDLSWSHCDIQQGNLGVDKDGVIKVVDIDMLYTNDKISEILGEQLDNCTSHQDCDYFDCSSLCDMKTKRCTSQMVSNNLQVVCRDLFRSQWLARGLLSNIPVQSQERFGKILKECSLQETIPWSKSKYYRIFTTLKRYLLEEEI